MCQVPLPDLMYGKDTPFNHFYVFTKPNMLQNGAFTTYTLRLTNAEKL